MNKNEKRFHGRHSVANSGFVLRELVPRKGDNMKCWNCGGYGELAPDGRVCLVCKGRGKI